MELTLLVLAAGMGSRYGGLKQMDPMGPNGETVLDYSVYDAIRAEFTQVVFVIREDFAKEFKEGVGEKFAHKIKVDYVFQKLSDLPSGHELPAERSKPWGTSHAVWAARNAISGAFAVINADDFYGADAYLQIATYFKNTATDSGKLSHYCMVGYGIENTLSDHGHVNRGICGTKNELLQDVEEITEIERQADHSIIGHRTDGKDYPVAAGAIVSMNFWGFSSDIFPHLENQLHEFLAKSGHELKSECYLPSLIDELIKTEKAECQVLQTSSSWFGVTYPEDKAIVVENIQKLISDGAYPESLNV